MIGTEAQRSAYRDTAARERLDRIDATRNTSQM
jgi:hypothetical protein